MRCVSRAAEVVVHLSEAAQQQPNMARVTLLALLLGAALLIRTAAAAAAAPAAQQPPPAVACPFKYERHTLVQIASKARRPYLFGGVYANGRPCPNCNRGGLWSQFCGFSRDKLSKEPYWALQLCNASTIDSIVADTLKQDNAAEVLTLTPCDFWPYMRGRTTWIIGDSMSKDLYKALKCFMVEFTDLHSYHASTNFTAMHHLQTIPGYGEPHCVHMPDASRICQVHAIEGDLFVETNRTAFGGVVPFIQKYLALPDDIYVTSFGLWHGETRQEAYQTYLHKLGQYYTRHKAAFPHMLFMETPKQHFDSEDGDFKVPWLGTRKGPWTCSPIKGVELHPDGSLVPQPGNAVAEFVARGSWRNTYARAILGKQYGMPLVSIYNVTVPAWRFHRSNLAGQECSHFCHPSLPQLWVHALFAALRGARVPPIADPRKQKIKAGCAHAFDHLETRFGSPLPAAHVLSEADRQRAFFDWLFGRRSYGLKDGVLVPAAATAGQDKQQQRVTPLEGLMRLLDRQQQETAAAAQQQQPHHRRQRFPWSKKQVVQDEHGSRQQAAAAGRRRR